MARTNRRHSYRKSKRWNPVADRGPASVRAGEKKYYYDGFAWVLRGTRGRYYFQCVTREEWMDVTDDGPFKTIKEAQRFVAAKKRKSRTNPKRKKARQMSRRYDNSDRAEFYQRSREQGMQFDRRGRRRKDSTNPHRKSAAARKRIGGRYLKMFRHFKGGDNKWNRIHKLAKLHRKVGAGRVTIRRKYTKLYGSRWATLGGRKNPKRRYSRKGMTRAGLRRGMMMHLGSMNPQSRKIRARARRAGQTVAQQRSDDWYFRKFPGARKRLNEARKARGNPRGRRRGGRAFTKHRSGRKWESTVSGSLPYWANPKRKRGKKYRAQHVQQSRSYGGAEEGGWWYTETDTSFRKSFRRPGAAEAYAKRKAKRHGSSINDFRESRHDDVSTWQHGPRKDMKRATLRRPRYNPRRGRRVSFGVKYVRVSKGGAAVYDIRGPERMARFTGRGAAEKAYAWARDRS